jgi:glycosyltransferase involved in cell wall biosynthesis
VVDRSVEHGGRLQVLHLSADFPDPIIPHKTPVIDRLIELVEDRYDHRVISLNRRIPSPAQAAAVLAGRAGPVEEASVMPFGRGECLTYHAPPRGLLHATMLDKLAGWIARRLEETNAVPDLVIGHKLTIEGILAQRIAERFGIPYALTIQGNTDQKILAFRPDLVRRFGTIYHGAATVFCFAPWARRAVERRLGERAGPTLAMPCPTVHDTIRTPSASGSNVISVFHLRNHAIKNLAGLVAAVRAIAAAGQPCSLRIFGGGTPEETAACAAIIDDAPGIALMGPRTQDELGPIMNSAVAFVMPSRRESFGLVFVEALFAGLPIIYPKGASIDGCFDGLPFAIGVDARNTAEIAQAICTVIAQEQALKAALAQWQAAGGLERFTRAAIAATFSQGIDAALATDRMAE